MQRILAKYSKDLLSRKIFVSGLPSYVTSARLEEFFNEKIGKVEIAYVIKHRKSKKSRGFGFVVFEEKEDREKVLTSGEFTINSRVIKCTAYQSKDVKKKEKKDVLGQGPKTDLGEPEKPDLEGKKKKKKRKRKKKKKKGDIGAEEALKMKEINELGRNGKNDKLMNQIDNPPKYGSKGSILGPLIGKLTQKRHNYSLFGGYQL